MTTTQKHTADECREALIENATQKAIDIICDLENPKPDDVRYALGLYEATVRAGRDETGVVKELAEALERIASYPDANPISDAHYVARKHARAALAKYKASNQQADGWRDIATAPKDGTYFLGLMAQEYDADTLRGEKQGWLHLPRMPFVCTWKPDDDGGYFVESDACGIHGQDCEPTWWMPLPNAPVAKAAGAV